MDTFEFAFDDRFRLLLRGIGVSENTALVTVSDDEVRARFGPWKVTTGMANVTGTRRTGDYRWYTAIGVRSSFRDRGVTFGTNADAGVCITFAEPVTAVLGDLLKHPALTVTVEDCDGLVEAIESRLG